MKIDTEHITDRLSVWMERVMKWVLILGVVLFIAACFFIIVSRINYPFELEWMEGGSVDTVQQILEGKPIYVPPMISYAPYGYPPLYFYAGALITKATGPGFFPLRLISVVASVICFFLIFLMILRETQQVLAAFLGLGLFIAAYRLTGTWFDIARADMVFLMFLLGAFYLLRYSSSGFSLLLAGFLITLSFLSKQSALAISLPIMLYCIIEFRRRALYFILSVGILIGLSTVVLDFIHSGWYKHYVFDVPSLRWSANHTIPKFIKFWIFDMALPLSIVWIVTVFTMGRLWVQRSRRAFLFYLFWGIAMLAASAGARSEHGGYTNGLLPVYTFLSVLFGLSFFQIREWIGLRFKRQEHVLNTFVYFVFILQFAGMGYFPREQIPTKADSVAGARLIQKIQHFEGDVLTAHHGYYSVKAGKTDHAQAIALSNAIKFCDPETRDNLIASLKQVIREKHYSAIFLDELNYPFTELNIDSFYIRQSRVFERDDVFFPVTGRKTRPEWIYVPRPDTVSVYQASMEP